MPVLPDALVTILRLRHWAYFQWVVATGRVGCRNALAFPPRPMLSSL